MKKLYYECLNCKKEFNEEEITISGDEKRCPEHNCKSDKIVKWRRINSDNTEKWIGRALWKEGKYPELLREYSK